MFNEQCRHTSTRGLFAPCHSSSKRFPGAAALTTSSVGLSSLKYTQAESDELPEKKHGSFEKTPDVDVWAPDQLTKKEEAWGGGAPALVPLFGQCRTRGPRARALPDKASRAELCWACSLENDGGHYSVYVHRYGSANSARFAGP